MTIVDPGWTTRMDSHLDRIAQAREAKARATEALSDQLIATGAAGSYPVDPIDGDVGFTRAGTTGRDVPIWTLEKSRAYSVAAYRANPMARAVIDTYTSFCVGDSGVTVQCTSAPVKALVDQFWTDPRVRLGSIQPAFLREHLLMGETVLEMLVGSLSGTTWFSPIDPARIESVELDRGNPMWPGALRIRMPDGDPQRLTVAQVDDFSGLRDGDALFWTSFKALLTDRRGVPFLTPILDDLDSYDTVMSNLIDRTSLARYLVWDVTVDGDQNNVDAFIAQRKGTHVPRSGSIEVHNKSVAWELKTADVGSFEDTNTARNVLTSVAGGAGLAKTWLADPEDSNRATSLTMAEPVRRRVGAVQNIWLEYLTDLVQFRVDRAVAARLLPQEVLLDGQDGTAAPSSTVSIHGPEIAASDAQVNAGVLTNLAQALDTMQSKQLLTPAAAQVAARKAWESFVGIPYTAELDQPDGSRVDDVAEIIDGTPGAGLKLA